MYLIKRIQKCIVVPLLFCHSGIMGNGLDAVADFTVEQQQHEAASKPLNSVLPALKETSNNQLSDQVSIQVKRITIEGNTVFNDHELGKITNSYINRQVTMAEIQQLRRDLTLYYVKRGYINSGATIPDQDVSSGIITFQITEGRLKTIQVSNRLDIRLNSNYLIKRIKSANNDPLNITQLQNRLQLLHQNPLINKLHSQLSPAATKGDSILTVRVDEVPYLMGGLTLDNGRSPSVGEAHIGVWFTHANLSTIGDSLALQLGTTEGLQDGNIRYTLPVSAKDTTLSLSASRNESEIIEEPFDQINITSTTDSWALKYTHPILRSSQGHFTTLLTLEKRKSTSLLDDTPFQFSPGATDGVARVTVLRLGLDWLKKSNIRVLAINSRFNVGIDALDSTINEGNIPDSKFTSWNGQLQWVERVKKTNIVTRINSQLSTDPLLSLEKFGIGGSQSVRGYRSNLFVRDQGLTASIEARHAIRNDDLQLVFFIDGGVAKNKNSEQPTDAIYSAGLGLLWNPLTKLNTSAYWGKALKTIDTGNGNSLQDDGFHFAIAYSF